MILYFFVLINKVFLLKNKLLILFPETSLQEDSLEIRIKCQFVLIMFQKISKFYQIHYFLLLLFSFVFCLFFFINLKFAKSFLFIIIQICFSFTLFEGI